MALRDSKVQKREHVFIKAAAGGHTEVVRALLASGADASMKADSGATALTIAREGGHYGIVDVLQQEGPK